MEFITELLKDNKKTVIMVVIDHLSKYAHFMALPHKFTTITIAQSFTTKIIKFHGTPHNIILDRDSIFMSNFWTELFHLKNTTLSHNSVYHLQINEQI